MVGTPWTERKVSLGEIREEFKSEAREHVHSDLRGKRFRNSQERVLGRWRT